LVHAIAAQTHRDTKAVAKAKSPPLPHRSPKNTLILENNFYFHPSPYFHAMSVIVNVPVDLKPFIDRKSNIVYLAVNKHLKIIIPGDDVVIWSNLKNKKGIFGYGTIITGVLKPTQIPKTAKIYDRNNFQIGVRLKQYGSIRLSEHEFTEPLVPASVANQLPSINEGGYVVKELNVIL
jgi:hypothetical protein